MGKHIIRMSCAKGIALWLKEEVEALGLPVKSVGIAGVETMGDMADAMRLNLCLRTAHRVLVLLESFVAEDADGMYRAVRRLPWEDFIAADGYFSVSTSVDQPAIRDQRYANQKCKDAIVDRIREKRGRRPDSGPARDRSAVSLYWKNDLCSVFLDTSGEPLSRRGYRKIPLAAPMQETLAAAVVLATGWRGQGSFVNPMCGSGTLAIEAALLGLKRAPGLLRPNFAFMHLLGFERALWEEMRRQAENEALPATAVEIFASDNSAEAIAAAEKNAVAAGVAAALRFEVCDFAAMPVPEGGGVVVMNPAYGLRMGDESTLSAIYKGIGDFFKKNCQGKKGYIFTGSPELGKKVGLKTSRRIPFFNGSVECRLLEYALYAGSGSGRGECASCV